MRRIALSGVIGLLLASVIFMGGGARTPGAEAQSFDVCIDDDGNKATALRMNSNTGEYWVCAGGTSFSGTGSVTKSANLVILQHLAADRRLTARIDTSSKTGSASFQSPPGKTLGTIKDGNTADSKCGCR